MKKEVIGIILFLAIMLAIFFIGRDRFERIENEELIQVSEEYMNR